MQPCNPWVNGDHRECVLEKGHPGPHECRDGDQIIVLDGPCGAVRLTTVEEAAQSQWSSGETENECELYEWHDGKHYYEGPEGILYWNDPPEG
jgi:hypothetical protein